MKKTKKRNKKNKDKEIGSLLMVSGCVFLVLSFVLSGGSGFGLLETDINRGVSYSLEGVINWEVLMAITLSSVLLFAGVIMFFASEKKSKK